MDRRACQTAALARPRTPDRRLGPRRGTIRSAAQPFLLGSVAPVQGLWALVVAAVAALGALEAVGAAEEEVLVGGLMALALVGVVRVQVEMEVYMVVAEAALRVVVAAVAAVAAVRMTATARAMGMNAAVLMTEDFSCVPAHS